MRSGLIETCETIIPLFLLFSLFLSEYSCVSLSIFVIYDKRDHNFIAEFTIRNNIKGRNVAAYTMHLQMFYNAKRKW